MIPFLPAKTICTAQHVKVTVGYPGCRKQAWIQWHRTLKTTLPLYHFNDLDNQTLVFLFPTLILGIKWW